MGIGRCVRRRGYDAVQRDRRNAAKEKRSPFETSGSGFSMAKATALAGTLAVIAEPESPGRSLTAPYSLAAMRFDVRHEIAGDIESHCSSSSRMQVRQVTFTSVR